MEGGGEGASFFILLGHDQLTFSGAFGHVLARVVIFTACSESLSVLPFGLFHR